MIPFRQWNRPPVTADEMKAVYEKIKTPKKLGSVIKWDNAYTDSATVFHKDGMFYMYFVSIAKDISESGYETHLAKSRDLEHWEYMGKVLERNDLDHWDSRQCGGYVAFLDAAYDGSWEMQKAGDSYYIAYLAGNSDGYEPDPLYMGMAKTKNPTDPASFERLPEPILRPEDTDVRPYEERTLYKSFIFKDPLNTTGYPYVNVYNAKDNENRERIYLAVSEDGEHWERYGEHAALDLISDDPGGIITGDPQIILMGDIYVMLFFRFQNWEPAYDTFACSRDLKNWTVWDGEPLIKSEYPYENVHAHKPWFIRHNGKNYHFYCAVNNQDERFIALATSE